MTYSISYEADVLPADLPAGAKVERKPLLPLRFKTGMSGRDVEVKTAVTEGGSFVSLYSAPTTYLNPDETRKTAHALLETIGELPDAVTPAQARGAVTLPAVIETSRNRRFTVEARTINAGATVTVKDTARFHGDEIRSLLDQDEAIKLRDALSAAIAKWDTPKSTYREGDAEPPASVKKLRDRDGDTWYRNTIHGGWNIHRVNDSDKGEKWDFITRYAPLTVVSN